MSDPIVALQAATGLWLFTLALIGLVRMARGNGHAALVLTCVHFVFFGVPLLLDVFYAVPEVTYPGFLAAMHNTDTTIAYCLLVAAAPILWQWVGGAGTWTQRQLSGGSTTLGWLPLIFLGLPLILALTLVGPSFYLTYGTVAVERLDDTVVSAHSLVNLASLVSIAIVATLVARLQTVSHWQALVLFASATTAFWINGKRAIIVIGALWIGYAFWRRRRVATIPLMVASLAAGAVLATSLVTYQWKVRGIKTWEADSYVNLRIDFGRDLVLKQALHAELDPGQGMIQDYRGQGLLFYATLPVPRTYWPDKPWPHAVYQTSRMLGISTRSIGWAITTSWLDECIVNLGLLGAIVGPVTLGLFCRFGHGAKDTAVDAATMVIGILFLTLQLAAFYPVAILWALLRLRTGRHSIRVLRHLRTNWRMSLTRPERFTTVDHFATSGRRSSWR